MDFTHTHIHTADLPINPSTQQQVVTAVWEFDKYDEEERALLFYSDREIRRMVRFFWDGYVFG